MRLRTFKRKNKQVKHNSPYFIATHTFKASNHVWFILTEKKEQSYKLTKQWAILEWRKREEGNGGWMGIENAIFILHAPISFPSTMGQTVGMETNRWLKCIYRSSRVISDSNGLKLKCQVELMITGRLHTGAWWTKFELNTQRSVPLS